jgi:hypothetical protein
MERIHAGIAALLALGMAGCADYGTRSFGSSRGTQEQTRVTSLPPLSLPPILTEHAQSEGAPPQPGQPAPGTLQARASAPSGGTARRGAPPSSAESSLLDAAGPSAPGDIRTRVDEDAQIGKADPRYSDALLSRSDGPSASLGGPLIQRGDKSWFDSIF